MPLIELNTGDGLSTSKLQVKLDTVTPNNDLCVYADGLYVNGSTSDGSGGIKLKKKLHYYYINTDMSPWDANYNGDNDQFDNHICCDCQAHRCWDATFDTDDKATRVPTLVSGKNEEDKFRPEIDWVLPGDFFRVKVDENRYEYFIITEVSPGPTTRTCSGCGQLIYPYDGYCKHGNPKYYYNQTDNPEYDPEAEGNEVTSVNENNYEAPKICQVCGQPILTNSTEGVDELIGLPGNKPVSWASLGIAGDW